jgi:HAD superfamily hydrolase (TIGR01544 family)
MNNNIQVINSSQFNETKEKIKKDGLNSLFVLSDFDRTLTHVFSQEEKTPSVISILRSNEKYLGEDYVQKAQALFDRYFPIESSPETSLEEKKKAMKEWWSSHYDLLIEKKLNKKHLEEIVSSGGIRLRDGSSLFLDFLHENNIPLVIVSSNGLGEEAVSMVLEKENKLYPNICIISNQLVWDEQGNLKSVKEPIIHPMNKDKSLIEECSRIKDRKNILLLGDNLEDVNMVNDLDYSNLIKVGFLNEKVEENISFYQENYDVLILNDSGIDFLNELLQELSIREI